MKPQIPFSRPSAAWVTDLTDKYRFSPNVQTTVQIIILQVGLTLLSILVFGWAIRYAQDDTIGFITQHIHDLVTGATTSNSTLPQSIAEVRTRTYAYVFGGLVVLNIVFGYLIARFALQPGRQTINFQKRFIGNVAHEIRTPLAIIKTSTEVALFDPALSSEIRETMESTITELDRISETINNLLSFDSLMRPKTMQFTPVDLTGIARTVCERHQEFAHSRQIMLVCEAAEAGLMVNGNATALDQVITNLTKNAINYTPAHSNGRVTVEVARSQDGRIALSVIDTGIGIEQKDLYHIFEPFYRADTSRARGIGTGTSGLGLAIVNEVIRLHHGTITLRSAPGHGTTIKVTFPPAKDSYEQLPLLSSSGSPHEATLDFS
jgi:signal transduction histidine kinase